MYLHWNEQTISDFSPAQINAHYANGYVFTRLGKGIMHQTRSVRVDLTTFELSSENRRILKKTDGLTLSVVPLPYPGYHWSLGKLAKDFYETKFGEHIFSANKVKELLTDKDNSNLTHLFIYTRDNIPCGYCIVVETDELIHYSYPFYDLKKAPKDMGMGMMLRAILYAQEQGKKYIYLGSAQRQSDTYKMQFAGVEWFDGKEWKKEIQKLKEELFS
ncbi:MAG TPA: hypothetical protein VEA18_01850 [Candidatus Kapabacteria bacterium]|nr:hypothetical protein [Candidatus Kapabacteria bacterium]